MLPSLSNLRVCNVPKAAPVGVRREDGNFVPSKRLKDYVEFKVGNFLSPLWDEYEMTMIPPWEDEDVDDDFDPFE